MNYWQNRGIEIGSKVYRLDADALPGTPPVTGRAIYLSGFRPVVQVRSRQAYRLFHNPDAWQPVNAQERMFQS